MVTSQTLVNYSIFWLKSFCNLFTLVVTETLEEALVGCDPEGPLCELLFFFLSAILQAQDEEQEEVAKGQVAEADTKGWSVLCLLAN